MEVSEYVIFLFLFFSLSSHTHHRHHRHHAISSNTLSLKSKEKLQIKESGQVVEVKYKELHKICSGYRGNKKQEGVWKKKREEDRFQKEQKRIQEDDIVLCIKEIKD